LACARAISYRYLGDNLRDLVDEAGAHIIALKMAAAYTVLSLKYGQMEHVIFGFSLLVAMFIYHMLYSEEDGQHTRRHF
jgi:hypothetical protein